MIRTRILTKEAAREFIMTGDCKQFAVEISALIDGELESAQVNHILGHITNCSACQQTYTKLKQLSRTMHVLAQENSPKPSLMEKIMERLKADTSNFS